MLTEENKKTIIDRILKLQKITDENATQGEIENASRLASKLIDLHQVQQAEIDAASVAKSGEQADKDNLNFTCQGQIVFGSTKGYCYWQSALASTVARAVGGVFCVQQGNDRPFLPDLQNLADEMGQINSMGSMGSGGNLDRHRYCFYGSAEDVTLAVDLFKSWRDTIATLALQFYGTVYRGSGNSFAMGFVRSLFKQVLEAEKARKAAAMMPDDTVPGGQRIVMVGKFSTIAAYLTAKTDKAQDYLTKKSGLAFHKTGNRGSVKDGEAYSKGKEMGSRASLNVSRAKKLSA